MMYYLVKGTEVILVPKECTLHIPHLLQNPLAYVYVCLPHSSAAVHQYRTEAGQYLE